jgi:SAM-dependent methyltransferase
VEPHVERDLEYPNGLRVRRGSLADEPGIWDVLTLHHVFEHVRDPAATLRDAARVLVPGGWLVLRMPVVPNAAWARYGACWVGLDAPRHLHLFTCAGLEALARRAGFEPVRVDFDSTELQFWASEQYRNGIALFDRRSWGVDPAASALGRVRVAGWRREAERLNRDRAGDAAAFLLRRAA